VSSTVSSPTATSPNMSRFSSTLARLVAALEPLACVFAASFLINMFWVSSLAWPMAPMALSPEAAPVLLVLVLLFPLFFVPGMAWLWFFLSFGAAVYLTSPIAWAVWPLYMAWMLVSNGLRHHEVGGLESNRWRRSYFWPLVARYFEGQVTKVGPALHSDRQYIFAFHPHGVYGFTAMWSLLMPIWMTQVAVMPTLLIATHFFWFPIVRELALTAGARSVGRRSFEATLQQKRSVLLIPGGMAEMRASTSKSDHIVVLTRHRGFLRMALRHGLPLVPTFSFGETRVFDWAWPGLQNLMFKLFGIPCPLTVGRWGTNGIPNQVPVGVVVGEPIEVGPPDTDPSASKIDALAHKYFTALEEMVMGNRETICGGVYKAVTLDFVPPLQKGVKAD